MYKITNWHRNGNLHTESNILNDMAHGTSRWSNNRGTLSYTWAHRKDIAYGQFSMCDNGVTEYSYFIHGKEVSEEEWRKFELMEKLAGI